MQDGFRITIYLVSFIASAYGLSGVDFSKLTRRGGQQRLFLLYLLGSMALGYLVAMFILGLSLNYYR